MVQAVESLAAHRDAENFQSLVSGPIHCLSHLPSDSSWSQRLQVLDVCKSSTFQYWIPINMDIFWGQRRKGYLSHEATGLCSYQKWEEPCLFLNSSTGCWERHKCIYSPGSCQTGMLQVSTPCSASGRIRTLKLSQCPSLWFLLAFQVSICMQYLKMVLDSLY